MCRWSWCFALEHPSEWWHHLSRRQRQLATYGSAGAVCLLVLLLIVSLAAGRGKAPGSPVGIDGGQGEADVAKQQQVGDWCCASMPAQLMDLIIHSADESICVFLLSDGD